jgi:Fe-S cluster biogenesis protein NfuA/nitrite reductase/ring-hydroxylating ferredoxin subunit
VDDREALERVAQVEGLLEELETLADPVARDRATALVEAVVALYGEGMGRIVEAVSARDGDGELATALAGDELVAHLLLLHGLHPVPVETRVHGALDGVRPYLESHGGDVEVLAIEDGVVRLRLEGSCSGCPSSAMTLKLAIEKAIQEAAPDVDEVVAEGAAEEPGGPPPLLQIDVRQPSDGAWAMAGGLPELAGGRPLVKTVAGEDVLFLKLDASFYAYRPGCPGCGTVLADAPLAGIELECPACRNRYDVLRAGRCLDVPELHLEPVPLLVDDAGLVKIALAAPA